jgi:glycosyltransferase involved in cell wall biosynthesis
MNLRRLRLLIEQTLLRALARQNWLFSESQIWRFGRSAEKRTQRLRDFARIASASRKHEASRESAAGDTRKPFAPPPAPNGTVLFAADYPPLFDQQSGGLRLKTVIDMVGKQGWQILFASSMKSSGLPVVLASEEGRKRYEAALERCGVIRFAYGARELKAMLSAPDVSIQYAFLSFPKVANEFLPLVRKLCPSAKIIYDMVDFHGLRLDRAAALRGDTALAAQAAEMRALEVDLAKKADITIAISSEEKAAMLDLAPMAVVDVLPNVFELPSATPPGPNGRRDILFIGGFWHEPNSDAVRWFVKEIWPRIREHMPECRFLIAGSNPGPEVQALAKEPGVEVLGYVADLDPLFSAVRVCVAPLRYGAGVKGKVGLSMTHGVPVVATKIGAEGMGLIQGEHALVADDPALFAEEVLRLMNDDVLWSSLQWKALTHVLARFSVGALSQKMKELFRAGG